MSKSCRIDGCDKAHRSRGLCSGHYMRWWSYGDPLHVPPAPTPLARFMAKVVKAPRWACWRWDAALHVSGYGIFGTGGTATARAHRWAYEAWVGPIPDGLHIDHLCSNRACVNPYHLEPVTQAENNRRAGERRSE